MHMNSKRKIQMRQRKKRRIRRKIIFISFIGILIISIPIFALINNYFKNIESVQADSNGNSNIHESVQSNNQLTTNKNETDNSNGQIETNLDNSGYLKLEDDPNADDASIISENINSLLTGKKHYPVRTDGKKVVYLTFDDGPSTTNTPDILKILDEYNVKATFFVMGKSLDANDEAKDLLKEIVKNGHAIGNHTYGHNYNYLYPNRTMNLDNIMNDLNKNNEVMKSILGKDFSTRVIRLPGGYWSWNGRTEVKKKFNELGIENIDWNALTGDAEGKKKNEDELFSYLETTVHNLGDNADSITVLMHDTYGKENTVKALPKVINYFKDKGFEFRTIK